MRILYFSRDYTTHDYRFLAAMAKNGLETHFLRLERGPRQMEDRPLPPEVRQVQWEIGGPFRWQDLPGRALALRRLVAGLKPDVIHAGPLHSAALVAALAGVQPLVSMSWGSDLLKDARASRWMSFLTRRVLAASRVLIGDCQAVREAAVEFGFLAERVVLFPWGVELERFTPRAGLPNELRTRLGWQDCFVALSLRSWEPVYGIDTIVRGFAQAAEQNPRLRLILLGGGSLAGQIQALLAQAGLHERVHLGGRVSQDDLPRYYEAADLYLSASHSDGSSVSLLEALASGLAVLVSDIPGNLEWIEQGQQGWLFPDGSDQALAEGLLRAADSPSELRGMGTASRRLAEARANWPENFKKLLDAYQLAMNL